MLRVKRGELMRELLGLCRNCKHEITLAHQAEKPYHTPTGMRLAIVYICPMCVTISTKDQLKKVDKTNTTPEGVTLI